MIKSTPYLTEAIERYSNSPWDNKPAYLHLLRVAWNQGWRGDREMERQVYVGLALVEVFHIIRSGCLVEE